MGNIVTNRFTGHPIKLLNNSSLPRSLLSSSSIGPVIGTTALTTFISKTLTPADTIAGSFIEITGLVNWNVGSASKWVKIELGGTVVGQFFPNSTVKSMTFRFVLGINSDKSGWIAHSANPAIGTPWKTLTTTNAEITKDFTVDQELVVSLATAATDTATLEFVNVVLIPYSGYSGLASNVVAWGDSMTAGTGATVGGMTATSTAWPAKLMQNSTRAVHNGGIGGEASGLIRVRALADVDKRHWTAVIWVGRNNLSGDQTGATAAAVVADIQAIVDNLSHDRYLIFDVMNAGGTSTVEEQGTTLYNEIIDINTLIASTFPSNYFGLRDHMVLVSTGASGTDCIGTSHMSVDNAHFNDTGYAEVDLQARTFLTAKGW